MEKEFYSYIDCKKIIKNFEFKNRTFFYQYVRGKSFNDLMIPKNPNVVYKKNWEGWGIFLGNHNKRNDWYSYQQCVEKMKFFQITNTKDFKKWIHSLDYDSMIPKNPDQSPSYKNDWIDWSDFFGLDKKEFYSYDKSREILKSLGIDTQTKFRKWKKSSSYDSYNSKIPSNPEQKYKEWVSWGEFLSTGFIAKQNRLYLNYNECKTALRKFELTTQSDFYNWKNSKDYDVNIPKDPYTVYKNEWVSWMDFLDKETINYYSYEETRKILKQFNVDIVSKFLEWKDSDQYDKRVPSSPAFYYKNVWTTWGDFFGTGNISASKKKYYSYEDCKSIILPMNFKSQLEYCNWYDDTNKDIMIPKQPDTVYTTKSGWISWNDFLGHGYISTHIIHQEKINFYEFLNDGEFSILEQCLISKVVNGGNIDSDTLNIIKNVQNVNNIKREIEREFTVKKSSLTIDVDDIMNGIKLNNREVYDMLIINHVSKLWQDIMEDKKDYIKDIKKIRPVGEWNTKIKNIFTEEYKWVTNYIPKDNFDYRDDENNIIHPFTMQILNVYRSMKDKRNANWSLAGTGKTVADILLSREVSHLTLIIAPNDTISQWRDCILNAYKDSIVLINEEIYDPKLIIDYTKHNYIILNYDKFQLTSSHNLIDKLLSLKIDKVTYDEVQFIKYSDLKTISIRRTNVDYFLQKLNPDYVQIISATPVTNNLIEPRGLLELLTNKKFNEITNRKSIDNLITVNFYLSLYGIRFKNKPKCEEPEIHTSRYEAPDLLNKLIHQKDGRWYYNNSSYIDDLKLLLPYKLENSLENIVPKTIVYTHWKTDIIYQTKEFYEKNGWSVEIYTGDESKNEREKTKKNFIEGKTDILICTDPIATGVNGLQKISHNMIILYLPWTYTLFYQLICRLYRTGQKEKVNIYIPMIYFKVGGKEWCYDEMMYKKINVKRKISDYSLDDELIDIIDNNEKLKEKITHNFRKTLIDFINGLCLDNKKREEREIIELSDKSTMNYSVSQYELRQASTSYSWNFTKYVEENRDKHNQYIQTRMDNWDIHPIEYFVTKLNIKETDVIVDSGCGDKARIQDLLPKNQVFSYDILNDTDNRIIKRDICLPSKHRNEIDHVFHSQSWQTKNFGDSIKNAYNELKIGGLFHIIQGKKGWNKHKEKYKNALKNANFVNMINCFEHKGFIFMSFVK